MLQPLLTVKEVAALLRVSPQTVYKLIAAKQLPAIRVGGTWRFDPERIELRAATTVSPS